MRCFHFIAGAALLTSLSSSLMLGQHTGGGRSGGAHVSSSSGYSGFARSGNSGVISGARAPIAPTSIGLQTYYSGYTGINRGVLSTGGRRTSRGFVPYFGYPYYLSTFDDYSQPFYYDQPAQDPNMQSDQVTANLLGEQMNRLSAEMDEMRAQQAAAMPPVPYRMPYASAGDPPQNDPPITLVLTDGTKLILQSYAVTGGNFWDFSQQPTRKIAISRVDLAASEKATEASGAEFPAIR